MSNEDLGCFHKACETSSYGSLGLELRPWQVGYMTSKMEDFVEETVEYETVITYEGWNARRGSYKTFR